MIRSDLIARIAERYPHLYQSDVERLVRRMFDEIANNLQHGNRVELRGFGTFTTKTRKARIGRNPRTGEQVAVAQKKVPHFKMGKRLQSEMNKSS